MNLIKNFIKTEIKNNKDMKNIIVTLLSVTLMLAANGQDFGKELAGAASFDVLCILGPHVAGMFRGTRT